jgi:beta-lactamase class A
MSKKNLLLFTIGATLVLSVVLVIGFKDTNSNKDAATTADYRDFPLLARRIFIENPSDPIVNFTALRQSLREYFSTNNLDGSLYFEYLPTGTSIRIDGEKQEVGASLIKLPAAMEIYKAHELGLVNLDSEVELKPEWLDSNFGNLYKKGAGYKLTLREATEIMLKDSDNTALKAVGYTLNENRLPESEMPFNFLDADYTQNIDLTISIGARPYSSFLKCLYFSCYLNKENSQEILTALTESSFNDRLVAGIDGDVKVAHKIGNFGQSTQSDCGIVYLENKNYVLCVMVEGPDNSSTNNHIAELSRRAFTYLNQVK